MSKMIRVSDEAHAWLVKMAGVERRTLTAVIDTMIEREKGPKGSVVKAPSRELTYERDE